MPSIILGRDVPCVCQTIRIYCLWFNEHEARAAQFWGNFTVIRCGMISLHSLYTSPHHQVDLLISVGREILARFSLHRNTFVIIVVFVCWKIVIFMFLGIWYAQIIFKILNNRTKRFVFPFRNTDPYYFVIWIWFSFESFKFRISNLYFNIAITNNNDNFTWKKKNQQNNLIFSWRWVEDHADPVAVDSMCLEYIIKHWCQNNSKNESKSSIEILTDIPKAYLILFRSLSIQRWNYNAVKTLIHWTMNDKVKPTNNKP